MSIYAISDLHLSFDGDKPMDIFGKHWENHQDKIKENWKKIVTENDLVILPGDFSWATYIEEMYKSFEYLENLPGKKVLLKGNHDYWWGTITSMKKYLKENNFKTIDFIYNNAFNYENVIILGTRGWNIDSTDEENKKILNREIERFKLSIKYAKENFNFENNIKIACLHFPPIKGENKSKFLEIMEENKIDMCIYGHLHGESQKEIIEGNIDGIELKMVSCDYTNFKPIKLK